MDAAADSVTSVRTEEVPAGLAGGLPPIVAICGAIGSGKSTAAAALEKRLGYRRKSFATPLKAICETVYGGLGVDRRHFQGDQAWKSKPIPQLGGEQGRSVLERVGKAFRDCYLDTWVDLAVVSARRYPGHVVFDDLRYLNEAAAVRREGGLIIRLHRHGGIRAEQRDHASDREWTRITPHLDLMVHDGDVQGLCDRVVRFVLSGGRE